MKSCPPLVLIVEDNKPLLDLYKKRLGTKVAIITASSLKDADEVWENVKDYVDLIVMDGCLEGNSPDTIPLVRKIKATFTGPIIASSSVAEYQSDLLQAGCTHEVPNKLQVPAKILELRINKPDE